MSRRWLIGTSLALPVVITIVALWFPFGFALMGLIEEWVVLDTFTSHGLYFIATPESPMASQALRPLTILPHAIAYFLDPHSFDYWNILLMGSLLVKGIAAAYLILKATRSVNIAMLMGVLILLYPADSMQFSFRCLHIHWALALLLLGSSLFVAAQEQKHGFFSYLLTITAALVFFAACAMYEAALLLMPLPFFILFIREGFRQSWKQCLERKKQGMIWISGGLLYVGYVLLIAPQLTESYQGAIAAHPIRAFFEHFPKLFSIGAVHALLGGWVDAVQMVMAEFNSYAYLIIVTVVIACILMFASLRQIYQSENKWFIPLRLAGVGLILMLLGYAPFLINGYFLTVSQRTFLWATPGSAMVWSALLIPLCHLNRWLFPLTASAFIFLGLGAQLFQFHHYVQTSDTQRTLLKGIVENFNGNLGDKTLLVFDSSNQMGNLWTLPGDYLPRSLSYFYDHPIKSVEVRSTSIGESQYPPIDEAKFTVLRPLKDYQKELFSGKSAIALRYQSILSRPFQ